MMPSQRNRSATARRSAVKRHVAMSSCFALALGGAVARTCHAFAPSAFPTRSLAFVADDAQRRSIAASSRLFIIPPPGSGYLTAEDEESELPDTYEPMMEYPGTMRPGRTPENAPFHDLPLDDGEPDPIPWPHFQQIEWHHRWEPPHPHPVPMEEFIEQQGRWATPEMEAQMRAGVRRSARQRKEIAEEQKRVTTIMDDDDDDEEDGPTDLGEGVFGSLGSTADMAITAAATSPDGQVEADESESTDAAEDEGDDLDDFLLDLGLDLEEELNEEPAPPVVRNSGALEDVEVGEDDGTDDIAPEDATVDTSVTASINVEEDDDLDLGLDEEELDDGVSTVPLEDFGDNDTFDTDEFFDDGGFDYDSGDFDAGDSW